VRAFVAEVQAAIAGASSPQDACATIEPRFADLLADSGWLPDEYQAAAPESGMGGGIGQWLLYRADDGSLSLFSLVVPPGSETPIHDHLAWGLVGLYRGTQDEEIYAQRGGALELVEQRSLEPGDFYVLIPPRDDMHRVRTTSAETLGLDRPADERHRLRLAARVGHGLRSGKAVPLRLRQRALRRLIAPSLAVRSCHRTNRDNCENLAPGFSRLRARGERS